MIFKDQTYLHYKLKKRISKTRFYEIAEICSKYGAEKKIAFSALYYHKRRNHMMLKEYRKSNYISCKDFVLSSIYQHFVPISKALAKALLKKRFDLYQLVGNNVNSSVLTFTAGVERLIPIIPDKNIEDIPVYKKELHINFLVRIYVFFLCLRYGVENFESVLQYYVLRNNLKKLDITDKEIIVEEARHPLQLFFLDYAKKVNAPVEIYFRGIPTLYRYYFGFKVAVTNKIAFDVYKKYNTDVRIVKQYVVDINKIKQKTSKENMLGFLVDIGRAGINFHDKEKLDTFINNTSIKHRIPFSISIHALDWGMENGYYKSKFTSPLIKYREDGSFEDYLNKIDILVGRISTAVYQAFLAKVPVILLDFFGNKPMESLVNESEGLVRFAWDKKSFLECYHHFNSMKKSEID